MNANKTIRFSLAAALSGAVALAPAVQAQVEPPDASSLRITSGSSNGAPVNDAHSASVVLPFGKSAIIDLPSDAHDILISNPQIADATVRTARRAYVIGRALGQTNIFFFDAAGRQIANVEIRVEPDVGALNEFLRRQVPNAQVTAQAMNGSIVLTGTARNAGDSDQANQLAQTFIGIGGGSGAGTGAMPGGPNTPGTSSPGGNQPRIINMIQVQGSEQVLVRVRVVEMSRTLIRQLGINLNYQEIVYQLLPSDAFVNVATTQGYSVNGSALGGLTAAGGVVQNILRPQSYAYPSGGVDPTLQTGDAGVGGYVFNPTTGQTTYGPAQIDTARRSDGQIQAFERAGLLHVLAEPNLTAISGEAARFLAGGEFPIPVSNNNGQVSVEFKPFGVALAFTPVVQSGGMISLKVSTEVSELTSEGAVNTGDSAVQNSDGTTSVVHGVNIPALQVRRAETTLEMQSGSSMVLAGLIQERTRHAFEGVPGVMNTPVIGSLFRSRDFLNNETELVIIVTPYLVRPTAPGNLHTPGDGYMNPTEGESLLTGRLNAIYRPPESASGQPEGLQGPHGHVIE